MPFGFGWWEPGDIPRKKVLVVGRPYRDRKKAKRRRSGR